MSICSISQIGIKECRLEIAIEDINWKGVHFVPLNLNAHLLFNVAEIAKPCRYRSVQLGSQFVPIKEQ